MIHAKNTEKVTLHHHYSCAYSVHSLTSLILSNYVRITFSLVKKICYEIFKGTYER